MRSKKYPLEALVRLRREKKGAAERQLGSAIAAREGAEKDRKEAEVERANAQARAAEVRDAESDALTRGSLSAADLQRQAAWQARVSWEDDEARRGIVGLAARETAAAEDEARAKGDATKAEADAKVVGEHRARWDLANKHAAEAAEEEDAADAFRPRPK